MLVHTKRVSDHDKYKKADDLVRKNEFANIAKLILRVNAAVHKSCLSIWYYFIFATFL